MSIIVRIFFQELDSQVYFLNPYEKHLRDETELKAWFKKEIVEGESICLIGHSLGGDLARYLASEFYEVKKTDSFGWWLSRFG